jgi:hypothetical protein
MMQKKARHASPLGVGAVASTLRIGPIAVLSMCCRMAREVREGQLVLALFLLILLTSSVNAVRSLNLRHFPKVEKWSKDGQRIENCCRTRTNRSRQCKKDSPTPIRPTIKTATAPSQVHLI